MATIKGVWKFNDTLVRDTNLIGNTYTLNFTGVEGWLGKFDRIRFSQYANTMNFPTSYYGLKMEFRYVGETSYRTVYESNTTPKWDYPTQTVDFGETEQTVSDAFYSWLTANAVQLFSEYTVKRETLTAIADSIRAKTGGSDAILTENMASEIEGIETGITPTGTLDITANGIYDVTNYASVNVMIAEAPPTTTSYKVTITGENSSFAVFDGYAEEPTNDWEDDTKEFTVTSGYISILVYNSGLGEPDFVTTYESVYSGRDGCVRIFKVAADGTIEFTAYPCLIEGTMVTLADGSEKAIDDITYDDELLVYDFYNGEHTSAKPMWMLPESKTKWYSNVTLSNGTTIGMVGAHGHRMYNVEQEKFLYPCDFNDGEHTITLSGERVTILSIERVHETVKFYNVITDTHYNLYANGVLTSCRLSNKYGINDMRYDTTDVRMSDAEIEAYMDRLERLADGRQILS